MAVLGDHELLYRVTWYWNFSERFFRDNYDFLLSRIDAARGLDLPSVEQLCRCFMTLNVTEQLPHIQQPTCVIVGEQDILKPVHYAQTIAAAIPGARLHILPGAGHASFWESAAAFNAILVDFLRAD